MPLITAIVADPRRAGRFDVVVDGEAAAVLSLEAIDRLGVRVGGAVDERLRELLARESEIVRVYDRAAGMLASRARARTELRRLLVRKKEPSDVVDAALDRLADAGFLDDAAFARQFARSKALGASMSRRRLGQELTRRGVDREVGDEAVDEVLAEEGVDESALIENAARKKLRTLAKVAPDVRRRRLYAYLARRGFDASDIARVVDALAGRGAASTDGDESAFDD